MGVSMVLACDKAPKSRKLVQCPKQVDENSLE